MKTVDIRFPSIPDVHKFVNIVSKYDVDVDLASGRYIVDGKSIMGIFSLDLLKPVQLTVHSDDAEQLLEEIKPYIV